MLVACDIDGTLADIAGEFRYIPDWNEYYRHMSENKPILHVIETVKALGLCGHSVVFITGRPESVRVATTSWLNRYFAPDVLTYSLLMRSSDDTIRPTCEIKIDILSILKPDIVFEDEPRTVRLLIDHKFNVLQVHGYRFTDKDMIPCDIRG